MATAVVGSGGGTRAAAWRALRLSLPVLGLATLIPQGGAAQGATVGYSAAQAERGATNFAANCAGCHGATLAGTNAAPPLVGSPFAAGWLGGPADKLFEFVSTQMPQDRPGAFDAPTYGDLIAFILKSNGIAAGTADFPTDAAGLAGKNLPTP